MENMVPRNLPLAPAAAKPSEYQLTFTGASSLCPVFLFVMGGKKRYHTWVYNWLYNLYFQDQKES